MSHRYSASAFLIFLFFWSGIAGATENYSTVRVAVDNKTDIENLKSFGFEQITFEEGYAEVIASASELVQMESLGLKYSVTIGNMTAYYQSRLDNTRMMGGYRTITEIGLALDSIYNAHPDIVTPKSSIGSSIEGRAIWVIKISDNPAVDENEAEVYYYACHHAREVITPEVLIYFMRYLTNNYGTDPQVTYLVNNRELYFSPCLNPDGYHYNEETDPGGGGMWRKNRRNSGGGNWGVDINRNYGYQWGFDDVGAAPSPSSETYRGTAAFSEPETMAQRLFINSRNFKVLVNYHSYSNYFLYPWGYEEIVTPDNDIFVAMGDTVNSMNGYLPGPPWQILYTVNGGAFDWEYGEQTSKPKIYALAIEVGSSSDGFWPPTNRITPLVQQNLQPNLFYARVAGSPESLRAPAMPTIYSIGTVDTTRFNLYWRHFDLYNPALTFEVWQMQNLARVTDSLEGGASNWVEGGFTLTTAQAHSATHSYFSGNFSSVDNRLTAGQALHVVAGDTLRFWTSYNLEAGYDYGYLELSTNSGGFWSPIPGNISTLNNPHGLNLGYGINGNSGGWVLAKFPLGLYTDVDVMLRFRYKSDGGVNNGGWYIDDINPIERYSIATKLTDTIEDTTLLVQNLLNGEYFYKVRAKDPQNQYSMFSPVAGASVSYPTCTWLVSDADSSGAFEISDAVYLISYIFAGGPAPVPNAIGSGDADCSAAVDISDAVYLIAYVFTGGPVPGPTCNCGSY